MVFGQRCNGKLKGNAVIIILRGNTVKINPSLNPGPALKSATNILGLRQLKWLTLTALPLSIIITVLPFSLPLQLCPKTLSAPWACPQECNQNKVLLSKMYIISSRVWILSFFMIWNERGGGLKYFYKLARLKQRKT